MSASSVFKVLDFGKGFGYSQLKYCELMLDDLTSDLLNCQVRALFDCTSDFPWFVLVVGYS